MYGRYRCSGKTSTRNNYYCTRAEKCVPLTSGLRCGRIWKKKKKLVKTRNDTICLFDSRASMMVAVHAPPHFYLSLRANQYSGAYLIKRRVGGDLPGQHFLRAHDFARCIRWWFWLPILHDGFFFLFDQFSIAYKYICNFERNRRKRYSCDFTQIANI